MLTMLLIVLTAFINFDKENFTPFTIEEEGGFKGTMLGSTVLFFAYVGIDIPSFF